MLISQSVEQEHQHTGLLTFYVRTSLGKRLLIPANRAYWQAQDLQGELARLHESLCPSLGAVTCSALLTDDDSQCRKPGYAFSNDVDAGELFAGRPVCLYAEVVQVTAGAEKPHRPKTASTELCPATAEQTEAAPSTRGEDALSGHKRGVSRSPSPRQDSKRRKAMHTSQGKEAAREETPVVVNNTVNIVSRSSDAAALAKSAALIPRPLQNKRKLAQAPQQPPPQVARPAASHHIRFPDSDEEAPAKAAQGNPASL
ncbi:hypothetical protein WJX73_008103 [Symbiochloris irregularis]|uniref:Uncharacterized protein n=1 Tax=Symbiochloris irregularis TaxID=706552 RepID=A0AAW1P851_9CHLO